MHSSSTLQFTALALTLMIFFKVFVVDGIDQYRPAPAAPIIESDAANEILIIEQMMPEQEALPMAKPPVLAARDRDVLELGIPQPQSKINLPKFVKKVALPEKIEPPAIREPAVSKPVEAALPKYTKRSGDPAKIVIIIDDMGLARSNSHAVIDLPAPMTLAFLPYADRLDEFTKPAAQKGHEMIIHVPMEPMGAGHNLGPAGLTTKLSKDEFKAILKNHVFPSFEGYVGINNHMGSRLTQDRQAMGWVMEELKARGLYFVDSKTIGSSVAARVAMENGVAFAERDVFLDHYDTYESVMKALQTLENVAHRQGVAIAIGHPKKHTIDALKNWMPSIAERGLVLVPASAVLHKPRTADAVVSEFKKAEIQGPDLPANKDFYLKDFKSISSEDLLGFETNP